MAINHFKLTIKTDGADAEFKLSYKNGKFQKMEAKKQKLLGNQRLKLFQLVPLNESDLQLKEYLGVEISSLEKKQSPFSLFLNHYTDWYFKKTGINHIMNGIEGNALKSIITNLQEVDENAAYILWSQILSNWQNLEAFYRKQMELRQINSNINIILRQLKNGNSENRAANNANDLRESL